jgi:DNA-directed RNA polymerase specialized sigma24 family protein
MSEALSAEEQAAERALALIRQGGAHAEEGTRLLCRQFSGRMKGYFMRRRMTEAEAEELVAETWLKILVSRFDGRTRAIVWIRTAARSVLLDAIDKRKAFKRHGLGDEAAEISVDDEAWQALSETVAATRTPDWVRLCVERAAHAFEQHEPRRAEVLRMACEKWSAEEIALYFGEAPPPSEKQKTAARNRVLDAMKKARDYFAHCKDDA